MNRIIITAANGFLGKALCQHFLDAGYEVIGLVREGAVKPMRVEGFRLVEWDGHTLGAWARELEDATAVVNLAGRSVNCRYGRKNRKAILESRVQTTRLIGKAVARCERPPAVWLNSSTATIYRHEEERANTEAEGTIGTGFSVEVAQAWEQALNDAEVPPTVRKVALRTSIVIGNAKGAIYDYFCNLAKLGLGGAMGGGNQKVSWVHIGDWCRAVEHCIQTDALTGSVNIAAPQVLSNVDFMDRFATHKGAKFRLRTPRPLIRAGTFLLRTEAELVLKSRWVKSDKLAHSGFTFRFPLLKDCLTDLQGRAPDLPAMVKARNKRWRYGLLSVVVVVLIAYRLLVVQGIEQSAMMFIGLPILLSFLVVGSNESKSAIGSICKAITLCFLLLLVFAIEGIVCVLMAAPLFYGIGAALGGLIDTIKRADRPRTMKIAVIPLLCLMSLEGVFPALHFPREQVVEVERAVSLPADQILPALAQGPRLEPDLPLLLKIGFPEPQSIEGNGLDLGAVWKVHMAGGEGKPGDIVIRVTDQSDRHVTTTIIEDSSHINHWLTWHDVTYEWDALSPSTTAVKMTIRFRRDLSPSWYFTPIEQFWVHQAGAHFLNTVFPSQIVEL